MIKKGTSHFGVDTIYRASHTHIPLAVNSVKGEKTLGISHVHDFIEMPIITAGEGIYRDNNAKYLLKPGYVFLLHRGVAHHYIEQRNLAVTNIMWVPEELNLNLYDLPHSPGYNAFFYLEPTIRSRKKSVGAFRLNADQLLEAERLIMHMQLELENNASGAALMAVTYFAQLLTFVCRCFASTDDSEYNELLRFDEVILFMNQNYQKEITRRQLAKIAKMGESTFYRHFKAIMNCSPYHYLKECVLRNTLTTL
jgi:AraC family L-rhamnose operon transcriptional activator RhaR/AraC family L-rhamnose operon regulatory protein RhaS